MCEYYEKGQVEISVTDIWNYYFKRCSIETGRACDGTARRNIGGNWELGDDAKFCKKLVDK